MLFTEGYWASVCFLYNGCRRIGNQYFGKSDRLFIFLVLIKALLTNRPCRFIIKNGNVGHFEDSFLFYLPLHAFRQSEKKESGFLKCLKENGFYI